MLQDRSRRLGWVLVAGAGLFAGAPDARAQVTAIDGPTVAHASDVSKTYATFTKAAVAADHPIASAAGAEILRKGGNAVDAAVAVSFALSVVRPESCGIGGGGFMVIHLKNDPRYGTLTTAINYREQCPQAIGRDFYTLPENAEESASTRGGKAIAIPGTVAGLLHALEKYGTLDRKTVLAPAIRAAREGYLADEHLIGSVESTRRWIEKGDGRAARFHGLWDGLCAKGSLKAGDRVTLAGQARALELIAERGSGAFYFGEIGEAIVESIQRDGGVLTMADLGSYRVEEVKPLEVQFQGRRIFCMPPPSSGGIALAQTFGILEQRMQGLGEFTHNSADAIHLTAEAMKHAFADRSRWLGDPDFVDIPIQRLLSSGYLGTRAKMIDMTHTLDARKYGTGPDDAKDTTEDGGTSHFSVIDERGNAVACTETINLEFGSMLMVDGFDFPLNNQMDDFLTRPGEPNAFGLTQSERNLPEPGKRPLSSMSPTIVVNEQGNVEIVVGASGGPRIISSTLQAALNAIVFKLDAKDATGSPRLHTQWMPETLWLEDGLQNISLVEELTRRGHKVGKKAPQAACQILKRSDQGIEAACDPRKGGSPVGY
jgi:gamma-glutamyltranspeptidase/glutathione hydrolase